MKKLSAIVYLGERTLTFTTATGGGFLGHSEHYHPIRALWVASFWTFFGRGVWAHRSARMEKPRPRSTRLLRFQLREPVTDGGRTVTGNKLGSLC
jgi:hypothetical protein